MPNKYPWGDCKPYTLPLAALAGPTQLIGRAVRLLSAQFNNPGGAPATVTLWDGSTNVGNDQLSVLLAAGGTFQAALMDIGIPFENGIVVTQNPATITGYLLVAEDDGG